MVDPACEAYDGLESNGQVIWFPDLFVVNSDGVKTHGATSDIPIWDYSLAQPYGDGLEPLHSP